MIKILTVLLTLSAPFCYADTKFDEHKARTLKMIDERLATITAHKTCVEKTISQDEIRECNKAQRMSAMKQKSTNIKKVKK